MGWAATMCIGKASGWPASSLMPERLAPALYKRRAFTERPFTFPAFKPRRA
jgi:hypothetical protein